MLGTVVNLNNYTKVIVYTHLILSSRGSLDSWSPFHIQQYTAYVERTISNNIELQKSRKFFLSQIYQLGQSSCCWPVNKLAKNALWKVYRSYKLYKYCIYIYGYIFYGYIFLLDPSPIIVRDKTGCCLVDLTGVTLADEESCNANTSWWCCWAILVSSNIMAEVWSRFETGVWSRFWGWIFVKILRLTFGQDFGSWSLVKTCDITKTVTFVRACNFETLHNEIKCVLSIKESNFTFA